VLSAGRAEADKHQMAHETAPNVPMPFRPSEIPTGIAGGEAPSRSARRRPARVDVAVVGGGLSGLVAAAQLAGAGASTLVLEARPDRVGGRLETANLLGATTDLGGAWVGADHRAMRELLAELGLETFPTHEHGRRVVLDSSRGRGRLARRITTRSVARALRGVDRLAGHAPGLDPRAWVGAEELDRIDLQSWLDGSVRWPRGRRVVADMFVNVLASEPSELSLLHAAWYAHAGGGLDGLVATAGGAQQDLVAGGAQAIAEQLAARLGDAVRLGSPVRALEPRSAGVGVLADGLTVEAGSVVVALPPHLAARIEIPAELGGDARPPFRPGDAVKVVAAYEDAFWRRDGMSGWSWGRGVPFSFTHDVSPPDGAPGLLSVFFVGERARRLRAVHPDGRAAYILAGLERAFGRDALRPLATAERDWTAEPWSAGGYGSALPPGAWTAAAGSPPASGGRVVYAGAESAVEHHGYMEGAVSSARHAAAHVLELA
jgi:monoamine oxidase